MPDLTCLQSQRSLPCGVDWLPSFNQRVLLAFFFTASLLLIAAIAEMLAPRRQLSGQLSWRWLNNLSLAIVTWYATTLFTHLFFLLLAQWTQLHHFGLMHQIDGGFWLSFMSLLLVVQALNYLIHIAYHHISWLWPIHAVHHSDIDVDISTNYRHHPLEPLIFLPITGTAIILLGVPLFAVIAYQLTAIAITLFSHSNVYIPAPADRWLRKFIVTPDFHRLHHCADKKYTNSNYGGIFPWFDYLFGTASDRPFTEQQDMQLGLEYARDKKASRVDQLIFKPPSPAIQKTPRK